LVSDRSKGHSKGKGGILVLTEICNCKVGWGVALLELDLALYVAEQLTEWHNFIIDTSKNYREIDRHNITIREQNAPDFSSLHPYAPQTELWLSYFEHLDRHMRLYLSVRFGYIIVYFFNGESHWGKARSEMSAI